MWDEAEERLALLELLARGSLKKRRAQEEVFAALAELPWTRATGRRDELGLVEKNRHELVALLSRVWPDWRRQIADLTEAGLPPTPEGWRRLLDKRRAAGLPELPERLNRRTAAALTGPHAKSRLTESRREALGELEATHDGAVRLRPPAGLKAITSDASLDLAAVAAVLGEVSIPERAFLSGLELEGEITAVLLIENLGAWRDLKAPEGWLLAHVPGWDTATVSHLLERLQNVPMLHFGDLDPNGVRIFKHLKERRPDLRWLVPAFWNELIESHGLRAPWPPDLDLEDAPPLVRELARRGLWLEQERIVLDPRMAAALQV